MSDFHLNPWFGEAPAKWQRGQLKRFYSVRLGKMLQPTQSSPRDELVPYMRAANVAWDGANTCDIKRMWASPTEVRDIQLEINDLLVSEGGDVGRSCLWSGELPHCIFQNAINRVRSRSQNSTKFLYYVMKAVKDSGWIDIICNKATIAHFTAEKLSALEVPLPFPDEQRRIAAYLDEQTGKIDRLMDMRRRQMALLKEQRAALIQEAVTRGLNPNVPMKDSDLPWLGEIPAHWKVKRLKFITESGLTNGLFKKSDQFGSGIKLVNVSDIYRDDFIIDVESLECVEVSETEQKSFSAKHGDLFFVRSSLKAEGIARAACMGLNSKPAVYECHLGLPI
jgi:type I restriction enzyme S subunit